jgi:MFS family permease
MLPQPASALRSRSYIGLILSQFLAAFNDQAIHAAAMFYAIHQSFLNKDAAISLMPILFFAPWAVFCTIAGYLADRYSKRSSLVAWKVAEIGITLVALGGFWLGTVHHLAVGPALVLSTVFLMGTHSAFFVPAKYGIMPEILPADLLSRGNGILESTSFLAVILGTVTGGYLSFLFRDQEYWIGVLLVGLAVLGAAFSLLIRPVAAANPGRPFPTNLFKPLLDNLRLMLASRPLALAILGIAFFTFMVAFMRGTMYLHGQSQNPVWDEFQTSSIVATVALGVGLGSPLAGFLSGSKVELGLVPIGAVGMILATLLAALLLFWLPGLIAMLVLIGFFSGFYIVPLYTLLQHRAPKTSKGDLIATSNFINVTGAIAASVLFYTLIQAAVVSGLTPLVPQQDDYAQGTLQKLAYDARHLPSDVEIVSDTDPPVKTIIRVERRKAAPELEDDEEEIEVKRILLDESFLEVVGGRSQYQPGSEVIVSTYRLRGIEHYKVRLAGQPLKAVYDQEALPRYLFIGASLMTLGILLLLCRQLPDFFVRALLWLRSHGRYRLKVAGTSHLPANGPAVLAANCDRFEDCLQVVAATDRFTRFILLERPDDPEPRPLLRYLANRTGLVALQPGRSGSQDWDKALAKAAKTLDEENLLGVTADGDSSMGFLDKLRTLRPVPILPVYCGRLPSHNGDRKRPLQVVIGPPVATGTTAEEVRRAIQQLGEDLKAG